MISLLPPNRWRSCLVDLNSARRFLTGANADISKCCPEFTCESLAREGNMLALYKTPSETCTQDSLDLGAHFCQNTKQLSEVAKQMVRQI